MASNARRGRRRLQGVVAVVRHRGRYLFIERGPNESFAGTWCPVGGQVERGESHHQALVREVQEEVGALVRPLRKLCEGLSASGAFELHYYQAELIGGEPHVASTEVSAVRWVSVEEAEALPKRFDEDLAIMRRIEAELADE